MDENRLQFLSLYLTRFSEGFGFIALVTLLPFYINELDPSDTSILGITIGAGLIVGLYTTGFTAAQTVAVIPLAWGGDRFDKRTLLLVVIGLGIAIYALFPLVDSSGSFIALRAVQGIAVTGAGLMTLSLVGEIAAYGTRARQIGKANAASFAASIIGSISAGGLYEAYGFGPIFVVIVAIMAIAWVSIFRYIQPDETRIEGFPFSALALNRRILTISAFRVQYAFAVTLVRTWVPIFAGTAAAAGGLGYGGLAVALTVVAEKFMNMVLQPFTGRFSDRVGRAPFVFAGGFMYGVIALCIPFAPAIGTLVGFSSTVEIPVGRLISPIAPSLFDGSVPAAIVLFPDVGPAFIPLVVLSGLLGVADSFREPASMALFADEGTKDGGIASSFGIRELLWRPGSVIAPLLGGWLMFEVSMGSVFFLGGAFAIAGALTFLVILIALNGRSALSRW